MQMNRLASVILLATALGACLFVSHSSADSEDRRLLKALNSFGTCLIDAAFSSLNKKCWPPRSESELKAICKQQGDAIPCIKEGSKNTSALVRRGMLTYVVARQRYNRKYCTNLKGDQSRKFLAATSCLMNKKYATYRKIESELAQLLYEVAKRNYTDPAQELKQLCCGFYDAKRKMAVMGEPECNDHRAIIEELVGTVIPDELHLFCEDDDKMAKSCLKVEPIKFKKIENFTLPEGKSSAAMALYLISTIGDPNDILVLG